MLKKKLTKPDFFIIAANIVPIIGAWFFGWDPKQIFMVYALETILIGIFTLLKMAVVTAVQKKETYIRNEKGIPLHGVGLMLFFLVHYGMFVAIQTGLFIQVSGISKDFHIGFLDFFLHWPRYLGEDAYYMMAGFFTSYGFAMYWNFVRTGRYRTIQMPQLMFQPYIRVFIQQFTVILGSMFLVFGAGKVFIVLFAAIKIIFEVLIDYDEILKKSMTGNFKKSGKE